MSKPVSQDHAPAVCAVTSGHTPGPWFTEHGDEVCAMLQGGAVIDIALINPMAEATPEAETANARLIAAAPDLLAVAKMMLATDDEWKALSLDERSRVEAAIDRAEGR